MKNIQKLFIFSLILLLACACKLEKPTTLKVMSFNIWMGGGKSIDATAEVLVNSGADIIGIQEAWGREKDVAVHIADSLGWHSYNRSRSEVIISKYPIVDTSASKNGVKIKIDEQRYVWIFNHHLIHCPYEPYQLNNIEYCGAGFLETAEEAVASAKASRGETVKASIKDILEIQKEGFPVFVTGDFNEPSFLDWTDRAVEAGLHKTPVLWPSTKKFHDEAGLKDSYRSKYPNEVESPGYTWTTLPETTAYQGVLDRIDFVLFWEKDNLKLIDSQIVGEDSPESDIKFKNYPSDHRAVLSTFELK